MRSFLGASKAVVFSCLFLGLGVGAVLADVSVRSSLGQRSPIDRDGFHYHVDTVTMVAGVTYVIDLKSGDFDSYLRVEDLRGNVLAEDDDSGGGLDARIYFTPVRGGTFRIVTTTYIPGETGRYLLTIRP